jgi:hypothetical protein
MGLPTDWYVNSGEASQATANHHQMAQECAKIMLELMRRARLNQKEKVEKVHEGELQDPLPQDQLAPEPSDILDAQVLYEIPELTTHEIPLIEPELIPDRPALPAFQHRPEQIAADTAQILVEELGHDGIYHAEKYTIERIDQVTPIAVSIGNATMQAEETIYRVLDRDDQEIFKFRDAGPDAGYDILQDELGVDDMAALLKARLGIEQEKGLDNVVGDPTFETQVKALGDLAPAGSQAANFAHYALDGYEGNTMKTPKYTMSRDGQGNVTIVRNPPIEQQLADKIRVKPAHTTATSGTPATADVSHNPTGQVLLRTEEGRVEVFAMTAKDQSNFAKMFSQSQSQPLNQPVNSPPRSRKPQLSRD